MTTFMFEDQNKTIKVEYITSLMPNSNAAFTIMDIRGLDTAETVLGFQFKREISSVGGLS